MRTSSAVNRAARAWTLVGLVALALNLRAAITGISPVLGDLQAALGLTGVEVSILTTLPVLCLGVFASLAPLIARQIGTETTVVAALLLITAGVSLRALPATPALFTGTALAGAGIAIGNVLMPAVIKRHFADRVGSLTGLVMMLMALSGAVAAGLAVPLDHTAGRRVALAVWALPALAAALVWGRLALRGRHEHTRTPASGGRPEHARAVGPDSTSGSLLGSPLAWSVAAFLGVVSLMFYVLVAWLPEIMQAHGVAAAEAGTMVSVMLLIGIPLGLIVPVAAARLNDQRPLIIAVTLAKVTGLGGILLAPQAGWLWICVIGLATGSAFPLAMTLLSLRSADPLVAARLSGMAQTCGYLLAGVGPLVVGLLHSITGGWAVSLVLLLTLLVPETAAGLLAARSGFVRPAPTAAREDRVLVGTRGS